MLVHQLLAKCCIGDADEAGPRPGWQLVGGVAKTFVAGKRE